MLITRRCYFKASLSLGITAKPAEDLSATGNKCPPEGCPAQAPGQEKSNPLAGFPPTPSVGHLCQLARHRVPDPALLLLLSLQPDLTPSGIYKDLSRLYPHMCIKMVIVFLVGGEMEEELRTFSGLLSPITPDCYHFSEDRSQRQSIFEEESGLYVLVNHTHHTP
ncbi:hypothetical protein Q8A73_023626 [Channa argus]|nr:hypothetical protein Q8A73_023626 [Channa argus]